MIRSIFGRAALALASLSLAVSPAVAANISVKDGAGTTQTMCTAVQGDSSQAYCFVYHNAAGAQEDLATKAQAALLTAANGNPTDPYSIATDGTSGSEVALLKGQIFEMKALIALMGTAPAQAANQAPLATPGTLGASGSTVTTTLPQLTATDIGGSFGTSAATLVAANATRHFLRLQVQGAQDTTGTHGCSINGVAGATADYHSLFIPRGALYESSLEVGTGAISIICTETLSVYGRQG